MFAQFGDAIMTVILAVGGLITAFFAWKVKRANTKAEEATERAEEAERQVQEAEAVNTAQERSQEAVRAVKAKSKPRPKKNRSDFERTK